MLRVRGEGMENGFDKNTLYACMEFSKNNIGERDGGKEEGKQRESRGRNICLFLRDGFPTFFFWETIFSHTGLEEWNNQAS